MIKLLKRLWNDFTKPSAFDEAWNKLQTEKRTNGMSFEYWRIWNEEVCPAYKKMTLALPKQLRHTETGHILEDMEKPVSQRKYY